MAERVTPSVSDWPTNPVQVASLHLDEKNPRLGRETTDRETRDIVKYLFEHDKAGTIAESIARYGFFPSEPLLAVEEDGRRVVVEGNRRLAALKALQDPELLDGVHQRRVDRLRSDFSMDSILSVPVTFAPSRRDTDQFIAARHIGTPILPWRPENRASFILDKLDEGYDNDRLHDDLGFTPGDIQAARQTRAIADIARSLALKEDIQAKIDAPRTSIFTTIERVFNYEAGRKALQIKPDVDHGFVGETTRTEFLKGFTRLVEDLVLRRETSRTLNKSEQVTAYFSDRVPVKFRVVKKRGTFVPEDVITPKKASPKGPAQEDPNLTGRPTKRENLAVLPRNLKTSYTESERIIDLSKELKRLKRADFPNSGAVVLRVFFELVVFDYLARTGKLEQITKTIESKLNGKLPFGRPTLSQISPELTKLAKQKLHKEEAIEVEKALRRDKAAPFTVADLNSFVHSENSLPTERDIRQFWLRIEPLIRLMLEKPLDI